MSRRILLCIWVADGVYEENMSRFRSTARLGCIPAEIVIAERRQLQIRFPKYHQRDDAAEEDHQYRSNKINQKEQGEDISPLPGAFYMG